MALCFADFEFTCGGAAKRDDVELLSIGLVISDDEGRQLTDTFYETVRPIRHPRMTKQCRKLTKLRQEDIDASFDAQYVCSKALCFLERYGVKNIFVWGNYDTVGFKCTGGVYEELGLPHDSITKTQLMIKDIQSEVMQRFGTKDIINVKDLSVALDFEPEGSFHNALVDAQALFCIYSHSLRPETGCEKVYALLKERAEYQRQKKLEQKQLAEQQRQMVIDSFSEKERQVYSSLLKHSDQSGARTLIKLHAKVEEGYKKLPEGCDIVTVTYSNRSGAASVRLYDKKRFTERPDTIPRHYKYGDKEKMILDCLEQSLKTPKKHSHRKKIRT
ncbi:MAG: exonuclease domain-containing protein [Ruminococcus sp.]|nr:exonuclease domain-containing protein [Ruminococcus sp.]